MAQLGEHREVSMILFAQPSTRMEFRKCACFNSVLCLCLVSVQSTEQNCWGFAGVRASSGAAVFARIIALLP